MSTATPTGPTPATVDEIGEHFLHDRQESGLTSKTLSEAGVYVERNPSTIKRKLNWSSEKMAQSLGECLAFPFRRLDGSLDGFVRYKPRHPRRSKDGKLIKYKQPVGVAMRAYFSLKFIQCVMACVLGYVIIVEGEKKCLAVAQAGHPAVALTGVWAWQQPRKTENGRKVGDRKLIPDLDQIKWDGITAVIIFDTDKQRNPQVSHARAELARVLTDRGARVVFVDFPHGPRCEGGHVKYGADDFIVAFGEQVFNSLLQAALSPPPTKSLGDYRQDLAAARLNAIATPGIHLDRSPVGSGKTTADIRVIRNVDSSLTVLQTHKNCKEVEGEYVKVGANAAAYPRMDKETCLCIDRATQAMECGLSVSAAVCPNCPHREVCDYQEHMQLAASVPHSIATHYRVALAFSQLAAGKQYISIHEDPVELFCRKVEAR